MIRFLTNSSKTAIYNLNNIQYMYIAPNNNLCGVFNGDVIVIKSFDSEDQARSEMESLLSWLNLPDDRAKGVFKI